jgi:hypothetical protein
MGTISVYHRTLWHFGQHSRMSGCVNHVSVLSVPHRGYCFCQYISMLTSVRRICSQFCHTPAVYGQTSEPSGSQSVPFGGVCIVNAHGDIHTAYNERLLFACGGLLPSVCHEHWLIGAADILRDECITAGVNNERVCATQQP